MTTTDTRRRPRRDRIRIWSVLFPSLCVVLPACDGTAQPESRPPIASPGSSAVAEQDHVIERMPVSSSAMRSVGYDRASRILEIEFPTGDVYRYFEVPEHVHSGLITAESHGTYFHQRIRNASYRYVRVSPETTATPNERTP